MAGNLAPPPSQKEVPQKSLSGSVLGRRVRNPKVVRSPLVPSTGFGTEQGLTESLLNEYTTERTPSVSSKDKALRAEESNWRLGQVTFPGLPATARIHHFQQVLGNRRFKLERFAA